LNTLLNPAMLVCIKVVRLNTGGIPATETNINVQMMLHYVNQNGPCAGYKYDQRPGLALKK
jgi:hypothetical protein